VHGSLQNRQFELWTKLPWENLILFNDGRLLSQGSFLIWLALILEDEETAGELELLRESRLQALLEGWLASLLAVLTEWRTVVTKEIEKANCSQSGQSEGMSHRFPCGWEDVALRQLTAFSPLVKSLDSTVACYGLPRDHRFGGNLSFRDSDQNLCIVSSVTQSGEATFTNRKDVLLRLIEAFQNAPSANELDWEEVEPTGDDTTVYTWMDQSCPEHLDD